jgi:hypothetical protein
MKAKQRGRPTKPAKPGEKATLSLRVTPDLKQRLEAAGALEGRNLSEEAERRLDASFRGADMLDQALDLGFGTAAVGLILLLARTMRVVGQGAAFVTPSRHGGDDWLSSPYAFEQVSRAIEATLEAIRPEGDVTPPRPPEWAAPGPTTAKKMEAWGTHGAQQMLAAVVGRTEDYKPQAGDFANELADPFVQWVLPVRARLGPAVVGRIKDRIAACKRMRTLSEF